MRYYWKKFRIQNFQSAKDITIDLIDGTNFIEGRNQIGKSTVMRAISEFHYAKTSVGKEFLVRDDCDYATITGTRSDDVEVTYMFGKGVGEYIVSYPDGRPDFRELKLEQSIPYEVQDVINSVEDVQGNSSIRYNVSTQEETNALIDASPGRKYKAVQAALGSMEVIEALSTARELASQASDEGSKLYYSSTELENKINATELKDLDGMRADSKNLSDILKKKYYVDRAESSIRELGLLESQLAYTEEELVADKAKALEVMTKLEHLEKFVSTFNSVLEMVAARKALADFPDGIQEDLANVRRVSDKVDKIGFASDVVGKINELSQVEEALIPLNSIGEDIEKFEHDKSVVYRTLGLVSAVSSDFSEYMRLDGIQGELEHEIATLIDTKEKLLRDNKFCPTCEQVYTGGHTHE